ncbi:MAG: DUF502 domain-containing protein [Chlamydiales bacterium]
MEWIKKIFVSGLKVCIPFILTILLIYWFLIGLGAAFSTFAELMIGKNYQFPGMGWILVLVLVVVMGLIVQIQFISKLIEYFQNSIKKLPVIKTLFNVSSDLSAFFFKKEIKKGSVVRIDTPFGGIIGIQTRDDFSRFPEGYGKEGEVSVYWPMSYQIGGYTILVPEEKVQHLEMTVEEAMILAMTAAVSERQKEKKETINEK